jgi:GT2 family glycosyltransferase
LKSIKLEKELVKERERVRDLESELAQAEEQIRHLQFDLSAIVNSRTWKLTNLARLVFDNINRIKGKLFFRYLYAQLAPSPSLSIINGRWHSNDNDPYFIVELGTLSITEGWYRFKLFGIDEKVAKGATVCLDYGDGFNEEDKIAFSSYDMQSSAVVMISKQVFGLRLDPLSQKTDFELEALGGRSITICEVLYFNALRYIARQRASGVGLIESVVAKIGQLGGWRNIRVGTLLGHVEAFDTVRRGRISDDVIIDDYQIWIDSHETPYFIEKYDQVRSRCANIVLVLFGSDSLDDDVHKSLTSLRCPFSATIIAVSSTVLKIQQTSNGLRVEYDSYRHLLQYLLEDIAEDENTHFTFASTTVEFSRFFVDAIDLALATKLYSADVVYFDSDQLDFTGKRTEPNFKPMWDREQYLSNQYVGPVCVFSKQYIHDALEVLVDGRQVDPIQSLLLCSFDTLSQKTVLRIPEIHYHVPQSLVTRESVAAETITNYLPWYAIRQLKKHGAVFTPVLPAVEVSVSIIIPTKDQSELLAQCIESIFTKTTYLNYELIIIDNGSSEKDALDYLKSIDAKDNVSVIRAPGPFNYSALNNQAAAQSRADVLVLLNNDTEVITPSWIEELLCYALQADVGCVGAKLYYSDDTIQHAGVVVGVNGVGGHGQRLIPRQESGYNGRLSCPQNYSVVTAACLAVRRELFHEIGGFNDQSLKIAFNDVDFCLKSIESGYRNIWTPHAELYHHESVSRGTDTDKAQATRLAQEAAYIMQRWGAMLQDDSAYNPNLSLQSTEFELSTRYLSKPYYSAAVGDINPCSSQYFYESNIERANSVQRQSCSLECSTKLRSSGLSIVILTLEKYELISELLASLIDSRQRLKLTEMIDIEIIVGDTGSRDPQVLALYTRLQEDITLVSGLKYQFSKCNNALFKEHVNFDTVLFLNNDIIFDDACYSLAQMYRHLHSEVSIGVVGAYMLYPTHKLQHGGVDVFRSGANKGMCYHPGHNMPFTAPELGYSRQFPAVTGACLMLDSSSFEGCDFFDESYESEAQDVDLCFKISRTGLTSSIIYVGEIIHFENATRSKGEVNQRDRGRFIRKWAKYQELTADEV